MKKWIFKVLHHGVSLTARGLSSDEAMGCTPEWYMPPRQEYEDAVAQIGASAFYKCYVEGCIEFWEENEALQFKMLYPDLPMTIEETPDIDLDDLGL
jgi:hypothetical protein